MGQKIGHTGVIVLACVTGRLGDKIGYFPIFHDLSVGLVRVLNRKHIEKLSKDKVCTLVDICIFFIRQGYFLGLDVRLKADLQLFAFAEV